MSNRTRTVNREPELKYLEVINEKRMHSYLKWHDLLGEAHINKALPLPPDDQPMSLADCRRVIDGLNCINNGEQWELEMLASKLNRKLNKQPIVADVENTVDDLSTEELIEALQRKGFTGKISKKEEYEF